jgi:glucokinase
MEPKVTNSRNSQGTPHRTASDQTGLEDAAVDPWGDDGALVMALDIGGTKIAGALVDQSGSLLARARRATPATEPAEAVAAAVTGVIAELAAADGWDRVRGVGIASAGPIDADRGTVSPVNIPNWRGFPLVELVHGHPATAGLPVVLAGDAVAMAAAEHWRGAARGHRNALCIVVSTGVGGGLVLGGHVYPGPTGNAGHIGHTSVDLDGESCPCGSRGCVEILASGPAIVRHAMRNGWRPDPGDEESAAEVARAARAGDRTAIAAFERAAQALAAGIAASATLIEIDIAVIGGGVAQAGDLLFTPLRAALSRYATLPFARTVILEPAHLGVDAGLTGAAALGFQGMNAPAALLLEDV